jgi:hypothetical protein
MKLAKGTNRRFVVIFTLLLAIFSSGLALFHQCHTDSIKHEAAFAQTHSMESSTGSLETHGLGKNLASKGNLLESGCVVVFIIVLLLGRKYSLLSGSRWRTKRTYEYLKYKILEPILEVRIQTPSNLELNVIRV